MDESSKDIYANALQVFKKYSYIQKSQKLRGLNDVNIFTTLLNKNDEVRLHSSFLHFLLDNQANHYQDSLFLEIFLNVCGIPEGFIDLESSSVFKEFQFIDLYITDGVSHIIIENKLQAGDQDKQIERYINKIRRLDNDESSDLSDRLIVIYLSRDRAPTELSLGRFEIHGGYLISEAESYPYYHITYRDHVKRWIERSIKQISNITNLSVILSQYRDVLDKIYGEYKGNVMSLLEFIESQPDKLELYRTFGEIASEYKKLKKSIMSEFWDSFFRSLEQASSENSWTVECSDTNIKRLEDGNKFGYPLRVKLHPEDKFYFAFEYHEPDFHKPLWGIMSANKKELVDTKYLLKDVYSSLPGSLNRENQWWMKYGFFIEGDFFEWVINQPSIDEAVEKFISDFLEVCIPCMEYLIQAKERMN